MNKTVPYNIYQCPRCQFREWIESEDPEVIGLCKKQNKRIIQTVKDPLTAGIPSCEFFKNGLKGR